MAKSNNETKPPWKLPKIFSDNFEIVGVGYLELVLSQADKYLIEIIRSGEGITEKAHRILAIATSVLTGCFIYLATENQNDRLLKLAALITICLCLLALIQLIKPLRSYETFVVGSAPHSLLSESWVNTFPTDEGQKKNLLLSECVNYEERINHAKALNRSRSLNVERAMYCLCLIPFSPLLSYVLKHSCLFYGI